jgi:transposase
VDLPHSDGCFVKAYPAETAEALRNGHVAAFDFFGGVPQSSLYDNSKLAVAKIVKSGRRQRSKMFAELQSHDLFEDRFGRPGKATTRYHEDPRQSCLATAVQSARQRTRILSWKVSMAPTDLRRPYHARH